MTLAVEWNVKHQLILSHTSHKAPAITWSHTPQPDLPPPAYIIENASHHMVTQTVKPSTENV